MKLFALGAMVVLSLVPPVAVSGAEPVDLLEGAITRFDIDGTRVYQDEQAHGRRCVAVSFVAETGVVEDAGELFSISAPPLPAGIYRADVWLKLAPLAVAIAEPLNLSLAVTGAAGKPLDRIDAFARGYRRTSVEFCIERPNAPVAVAVRWSRRRTEYDDKRPEVDDAVAAEFRAKMDKLAPDFDGRQPDDLLTELEADLTDRPLDSLGGRFIAVDRVLVTRIGSIRVGTPVADKIRYRPGETASVSCDITSFAPQAHRVEVELQLVREFDSVETVHRESVDLVPSRVATVAAKATLDDRRWGHELRCIVREGGKEVARASEFFTVHDNVWAVVNYHSVVSSTMWYHKPTIEYATPKDPDEMARGLKASYINAGEFGFWAPCDFGDYTPEGEYYSGQHGRHNSAESTKICIDSLHKVGIAAIVYGKPSHPCGKAGYETLRKMPLAGINMGGFDVAKLDRWNRANFRMHYWPTLSVTHSPKIRDLFRYHGEEVARSCDMFGWDGIRYDTWMEYYSGELMKIIMDAVNARHPDFRWGNNASATLPAIHNDDTWPVHCHGGQMILNEDSKRSGGWGYDHFVDHLDILRRVTHPLGGFNVVMGSMESGKYDLLYQDIIINAARHHPTFHSPKPYAAFSTRYAQYLWDNRARPLPGAKERVHWGDGEEHLLRWANFAYLRDTGDDGSELILHMINKPPVANFGDGGIAPPERENFTCAITLPAALPVRDLWCASGDDGVGHRALPFRRDGDVLSFDTGTLEFWNMLVVRFDGRAEW